MNGFSEYEWANGGRLKNVARRSHISTVPPPICLVFQAPPTDFRYELCITCATGFDLLRDHGPCKMEARSQLSSPKHESSCSACS